MINAKEARELMESSLSKIKDATWKKIEETIETAVNKGDSKCNVWVKKEIADDIEWTLEYTYNYTVGYDTIPSSTSSNCYYMTISW